MKSQSKWKETLQRIRTKLPKETFSFAQKMKQKNQNESETKTKEKWNGMSTIAGKNACQLTLCWCKRSVS